MRRQTLALVAIFGATVASCKPTTTSGVKDSAPGGQESDVNSAGGPDDGSEVGSSLGAANEQFNSQDYFSPDGQPFTWTDDMTQSVVSGLAPTCPGVDPPTDGSGTGQVAFAIDGNCQMFSLDDATQEVANLGGMYSAQGTNLVDVIANEATSEDLQTVEAAAPAIDLGAVVNQQNGTSLALLGPNPKPKPLALDDDGGGPGWVGQGKNYTVGSSQFASTTTAYYYVRNQNGVGLHTAVDVTGKAFSIQRSLVYAKLEGQALTLGTPGEVDLEVQVFGADVYSKTIQEPQIDGSSVPLATLNKTFSGSLNFSIGPIPFDVTWSFLVTGAVNASYSLRATSVAGELDPTASATVGLEGGPDIKVAKAGVDGQLTIVNASLNGNSTVALSTNGSGQPAVCYDAALTFALNNLLGGSLSAYAQIGNPSAHIGSIPLGWRGDLKFVNWTGTNYSFPIVSAQDQCLAVVN